MIDHALGRIDRAETPAFPAAVLAGLLARPSGSPGSLRIALDGPGRVQSMTGLRTGLTTSARLADMRLRRRLVLEELDLLDHLDRS